MISIFLHHLHTISENIGTNDIGTRFIDIDIEIVHSRERLKQIDSSRIIGTVPGKLIEFMTRRIWKDCSTSLSYS